jgi:hypothetical protein
LANVVFEAICTPLLLPFSILAGVFAVPQLRESQSRESVVVHGERSFALRKGSRERPLRKARRVEIVA